MTPGAGQNFFHSAQLPDEVVTRNIVIDPKICYLNGHLLNISGTIALFLLFCGYVVKTEFYVCYQLESKYNLGGYFFDHFFEATRIREKKVELDYYKAIPIVFKPETRTETETMKNPEDEKLQGRI